MEPISIISREGQTLASTGAEKFVALLNIPSSGDVLTVLGENFEKATKLIVEEKAKEATVTLKVKLKPCKSENQLFDIEVVSTVTAPPRKFMGATFIGTDYKPSVNRTDPSKFIYHSRG